MAAPLALPEATPRLTRELLDLHLDAYRRDGFEAVALRTDERLELGAWPLAEADAATIERHAIAVARGQAPGQRVQLLFKRHDGTTEGELYEVHDQAESLRTEGELAREMLGAAHDHIRKMHLLVEKLAGAQVAALQGMWDFSQSVVGTAARERAELVEELIERRRDEDGTDRAYRLLEMVIPTLGPQAGALMGALAQRLASPESKVTDGSTTEEEDESRVTEDVKGAD